jgi:hypothetical protein
MSIARLVLLGAVAVVAWDTIASFAARILEFPYVWASVGSWILYLWIGYQAAAPPRGVAAAAGAAAAVALVDASIGWAISWKIGPGRPTDAQMSGVALVGTVITVMAFMALVGALGGAARRFVRRRA